MTARRSYAAVWRWPALLAACSLFGLSSALLGQRGLWLPLSWVALSAPLVVVAISLLRPPRRPGTRSPFTSS